MTTSPEAAAYRYDAFISYRHVEPDRKWAKWLHGALETYRVPRELVAKGFPKRLTRVFRDEEELPANADLSTQITTALDESKFLIVICSPRAPLSKWVNAEVEHFRKLGRHDKILALLIEGEPRESFPAALTEIRRSVVDAGTGQTREQIEEVEPLAADVRPERSDTKAHTLRSHARLRLLACMLGCRFDDLRQREAERRVKFARVLTAGLIGVAIGLSGLTTFAFIQRTEAKKQQGIAETNAAKEKAAKDNTQSVIEFVVLSLRSSDPYSAGTQTTTIADAMQNAQREVESGRFRDAPETEWKLLTTIGTILSNNGKAAEAEPLIRAALLACRKYANGDHPDLASCFVNLGAVNQALQKFSEAETWFIEALAMRRRLYKEDNADVATALEYLAMLNSTALNRQDRAELLCSEALAIRQRLFKGDHADIAESLDDLGLIAFARYDSKKAVALRVEALEMRKRLFVGDNPAVALSLTNLGSLLQSVDRMEEAEPLLSEGLAMFRRLFNGDHSSVVNAMNNVAGARLTLGRLPEAEALFAEALAMSRRLFKEDHHDIALTLNNLAFVMEQQGRFAEAEKNYVEALGIRRRTLPENHEDLATSLNNLGGVLRAMQRFDEAEPLFAEALEMRQRLAAGDNEDLATSLNALAIVRLNLGRNAEAEKLLAEAVGMGRRLFGDDHVFVANMLVGHARSQQAMGQVDSARQQFDWAIRIYRGQVTAQPVALSGALWRSAIARMENGDAKAALPEVAEAVAIAEKRPITESKQLEAFRKTLVECKGLIEQAGSR